MNEPIGENRYLPYHYIELEKQCNNANVLPLHYILETTKMFYGMLTVRLGMIRTLVDHILVPSYITSLLPQEKILTEEEVNKAVRLILEDLIRESHYHFEFMPDDKQPDLYLYQQTINFLNAWMSKLQDGQI